MLLPMYFLIGVWGGPRREYAAIKFFLYTLLGSVLMLIAILMLYFNSDLQQADRRAVVSHGVVSVALDDAAQQAAIAGRSSAAPTPQHTFNILALQQMGQHTDCSSTRRCCGWASRSQWWAFVLLFIGFAIKVPSVPFHTWLPDAHVEAPTPISMILAGVLLKMGGYGIIRICYPICPDAGYDLAYVRVRHRRGQHGLRRVCRHGAERLQAAGRLQLGQPHGLRRAGHRRVERGRRQQTTIPTTGRWA